MLKKVLISILKTNLQIYWTDFAKKIYWRNEDKIYKLIYKKQKMHGEVQVLLNIVISNCAKWGTCLFKCIKTH